MSPSNSGVILREPSTSAQDFVQNADDTTCLSSSWAGWPQTQERAVENGTVLVWNVVSSIGHFMRTLVYILPLVRLLQVGLIINPRDLPAFRVAFEPASVKWDVDPAPFLQLASDISQGVTSNGLHSLENLRGTFILSDTQLHRLAKLLAVEGGDLAAMRSGLEAKLKKDHHWRSELSRAGLVAPPSCAWNMLLRRSVAMVSSMEAHNPWKNAQSGVEKRTPYSAWHIRTSEGESVRSYSPDRHAYIFNKQSPAHVCPLFVSTVGAVSARCPRLSAGRDRPFPVFISSNSKTMARNCSVVAGGQDVNAGFVDLGVSPNESHTMFSTNPDAAVNAFVDFLYMMDAAVVVSTGSSFSSAVAEIKGHQSHLFGARDSIKIVNKMFIFLPRKC